MNEKEKAFLVLMAFAMSATFIVCSSAGSNQQKQCSKSTSAGARKESSLLFQVYGSVYPDGLFYISLNIGHPLKPYYLDIDTGSDITWLQCNAPCVHCSEVPHSLYQPSHNSTILCQEPVCISLTPEIQRCHNPEERCVYEVNYIDHGYSIGVLLRDIFPVRFTNGTILKPKLAFGCGYDQYFPDGTPPGTDGVLGLGSGKSSIISQLRDQGLTRNVIGHCFSSRGGGYLFFGDDLVPSSGVVWTPMKPSHKHYSPGNAELIYGGKSILRNLHIVFDTGSSYTYFNEHAYEILISSVRKDLIGKPLKETPDEKLSICWKGSKPFKSISEVKNYFKPFSLSFTNGKKAQMELLPEFYLIITPEGNVCFGILNGGAVEDLGNINLIGDISLLDKVVIYDNERKQIGWAPANCDKFSIKDGRNEGFSHPYPDNYGSFFLAKRTDMTYEG